MNVTLFAPETLQYSLPIAVGLGVTLMVIFVMMVRGRARSNDQFNTKENPSNMRSSEWITPEQSLSNRRNSVRREGVAVKVQITSSVFRSGAVEGYVVDRSTGGLRLATKQPLAPGSTLQIRANHAPEATPWVTLIVRNCHDSGKHYQVGCEFEKIPPWNVLLLFG